MSPNGSIPLVPIEGFKLDESGKIIVWVLCGCYSLLAIIPLVQLVRIQRQAYDSGWTIQKLFLAFLLSGSLVRAIFFGILELLRISNFFLDVGDEPSVIILTNIPRVVYFSSFCLLILFWAEIIHRVQNQTQSPQSFHRKRNLFIAFNVAIYVVQSTFWLLILAFPVWSGFAKVPVVENLFFAALSCFIAVLFLIYGGRLFFILKKFPIESTGLYSKLYEVGSVTITCTVCFLARAIFLVITAIVGSLDLNAYVMLGYYLSTEVAPGTLVLLILSNLPGGADKNSSTDSKFPSSAEGSFYGSAVVPEEPETSRSMLLGTHHHSSRFEGALVES